MWIFLLLGQLTLSSQAQESRPAEGSILYLHQNSRNYQGNWVDANVDAPVEKWRLGVDVDRLDREYNGGPQIVDTVYGLHASHSLFSKKSYFETSVSVSPDSLILPRLRAAFTPRWALGRWDFGVGLDYLKYQQVEAGLIHPDAIYEINSLFTVSGGVYVGRTYSTIASPHAEVTVHATQMHSFKAGVSAGETMEDAGLQAHFTSVSGEYRVDFRHFNVSLVGQRYWSDTRREDAIGFRLGVK